MGLHGEFGSITGVYLKWYKCWTETGTKLSVNRACLPSTNCNDELTLVW